MCLFLKHCLLRLERQLLWVRRIFTGWWKSRSGWNRVNQKIQFRKYSVSMYFCWLDILLSFALKWTMNRWIAHCLMECCLAEQCGLETKQLGFVYVLPRTSLVLWENYLTSLKLWMLDSEIRDCLKPYSSGCFPRAEPPARYGWWSWGEQPWVTLKKLNQIISLPSPERSAFPSGHWTKFWKEHWKLPICEDTGKDGMELSLPSGSAYKKVTLPLHILT